MKKTIAICPTTYCLGLIVTWAGPRMTTGVATERDIGGRHLCAAQWLNGCRAQRSMGKNREWSGDAVGVSRVNAEHRDAGVLYFLLPKQL